MNPEMIEAYWRDEKFWKAGVFYRCAADPRLIVPKKKKWRGWTLNFARPMALPALLLSVGLVGGPLGLAIHFGHDPRSVLWWSTLAAVVTVVIIICACAASPERYKNHRL